MKKSATIFKHDPVNFKATRNDTKVEVKDVKYLANITVVTLNVIAKANYGETNFLSIEVPKIEKIGNCSIEIYNAGTKELIKREKPTFDCDGNILELNITNDDITVKSQKEHTWIVITEIR